MTEKEPRTLSAHIGHLARLIRESGGLSQTDIAELMTLAGCAWSQPIVARVEAGHRDVTAGELVALGLIFDVQPQVFARGGMGGRVRLGRGPEWFDHRVVSSWLAGDENAVEHGDVDNYPAAAEGWPAGRSRLFWDARHRRIRHGVDLDDEQARHVEAQLLRWEADELDAGRQITPLRRAGARAQLAQQARGRQQ